MKERFLRVEESGMAADDLARALGTTEMNLARWIAGTLPPEEADVIEVGLLLLERMSHIGAGVAVESRRTPTLRLRHG